MLELQPEHNFKVERPMGMYDNNYKCENCGQYYSSQIDNPQLEIDSKAALKPCEHKADV